jgi:hypothetical protein
MMRTSLAFLALCCLCLPAQSAPDYDKRAQSLSPQLQSRLMGKWTNPVDGLVIEISAFELKSGQLIGWVSAAPPKESFDNVVPVTFSSSLYEYGTLPVWAGYLRDDKLITMHYLVWPNRAYPWDHISAFQEIWTRVP